MSDDYEIGYKKPPKARQFKKGQSGNPAGRPLGAKNKKPSKRLVNELSNMILSEADRLVPITEHGERAEIPLAQLILRKMAADAAKGSDRARKEFLTMTKEAQQHRIDERVSLIEAAMTFQKNAWSELDRCKNWGIDPPEIIPHPGAVNICLQTGTVTITGPKDRGEKEQLEKWQSIKDHFEAELRELRDELKIAETEAERALTEQDIAEALEVLEMAKGEIHALSTVVTVSQR
ncbi:MAG: DUF5681 domain-containing protein [Pseudomonadota bacterium]